MPREPKAIRGIVFDLFHTLVDPEDFRPKDFIRANAVASLLSVDQREFARYWESVAPLRNTNPRPVTEFLGDFLDKTGRSCSMAALKRADKLLGRYQDMAILKPRPDVGRWLRSFSTRGFKLGLLTNADEREVRQWERSPLARYFSAAGFSCEIGYEKPHVTAYRTVLERLGESAPSCAYVGDGGSRELLGARESGFGLVVLMKRFVSRNGLRTRDELSAFESQADLTVQSLRELYAAIALPSPEAEITASPMSRPSLAKEEDTTAYWDRKWALRKQHLREEVTLDGSNGEIEFERELQRRARGKEVLDVGCGPGEFTLRIATKAKSIVGIDPSRTALALAKGNLANTGIKNAFFRYGDIRRLPFPNESFDVAYSRRGPASDDKHNLSEVLRVLRRGGVFMEITIGERDKQNLADKFGRGQMRGFRGQVSAVKKRRLKEVGFREVVSRDYLGTEVFHSLDDLVIRLRTAPIIPSFDPAKDRRSLDRVKEECMTDRGIETPVHRVVLVARK